MSIRPRREWGCDQTCEFLLNLGSSVLIAGLILLVYRAQFPSKRICEDNEVIEYRDIKTCKQKTGCRTYVAASCLAGIVTECPVSLYLAKNVSICQYCMLFLKCVIFALNPIITHCFQIGLPCVFIAEDTTLNWNWFHLMISVPV